MVDAFLRVFVLEASRVIGKGAALAVLNRAYSQLGEKEKKEVLPSLVEVLSSLRD